MGNPDTKIEKQDGITPEMKKRMKESMKKDEEMLGVVKKMDDQEKWEIDSKQAEEEYYGNNKKTSKGINPEEYKDYVSYQKAKEELDKEKNAEIANKLVLAISDYYKKKGATLNNKEIGKEEESNKNIESERQEFLKKILEYREKERFYNEEKIRLNNLLQTLNAELKLSQEKDEQDYLESIKKKREAKKAKDKKVEPIIKNAEKEEMEEIVEIKNEQETVILNGPKQIKIEEVIDENVSVQEMVELQKEFPRQNIEEIIENQVIEQINDKTIVPVEERKKWPKLKSLGRKVKIGLLSVFVSATAFTFKATTIYKTADSANVLSYDNIKVNNLKDWESVKLYEDEINNLENISIITKANENSNDKFIIIDKQNGKAHRYQGDNLIKSYNVCLGDSTGDEQTKLKSIYRKKFEDSDYHRRPEVSLDEATYVKDGERYLKEGYEACTAWGGGNMETGAGIYTVSNRGPFLGDFGIFIKNERGQQVATSLHVNEGLKKESPNFRFTNGCIGFSKEDLLELYNGVSSREKIYILPDNPHNRYQIIDGELRFLSNQKDVNRTIRPYKPEPIILKAENPTKTAKDFLVTISENKEKLMKLYPTISNDVYNELAKIAYGILGQESTFGTYGGPRGQFGRARDIALSTVGLKPSVGPGQVRLENVEKKVKDAFNMKKNTDLFKIETNAIAVMSILLDNYLSISYNNKEEQYKKLVILRYNAPKEAKAIIKGKKEIDQLDSEQKSYIKKILDSSKHVTVYTTKQNYYNPDWNYTQPNEIAMNNINN